jgi:hypothetical protein
VIDNKCGGVVNLNAVESILEAGGELPVNLKFIFKGEEESGSPSMEPFVKAHKDLLRADLLVSSDGGSYDKDLPKVFSSLRGLVSAEVSVTGPVRDLHSGSYGGVVHNPAHMTAKLLLPPTMTRGASISLVFTMTCSHCLKRSWRILKGKRRTSSPRLDKRWDMTNSGGYPNTPFWKAKLLNPLWT